MMLSRSLSVQYLSVCDGVTDRSLPFPVSIWSDFGFGEETHGFYTRGAIVGNLASVLIFTLVVFIFGCVMVALGKANDIQGNFFVKATVFTMMPSSICIAVAVILDGTIFSSVNLLARIGDSPSTAVDVVLAVLGLALPIGFLYGVVLIGMKRAMGIESEKGGLKFGPSYVTTHVDICLTRFARGRS